MNKDQINELYSGKIFGLETQKIARKRIHWVCSQVQGKDILDIGCSQGIVCLILGREGFNCIGIDAETDAIAYAQQELEKEEEATQKRVQFQLQDATGLSFEDEAFDTVILGEILEHFTNPQKILQETFRVLKESGRVIITVPYGLNPHPDHKKTYYLLSFLEIVQPFFRSVLIDTMHDYIIYIGEKDSAYAPLGEESIAYLQSESLRLQKKIEERCLAKEELLYEKSTQFYEQSKLVNEQIVSLKAKNSELETALGTQKQEMLSIKNNFSKRCAECEKITEIKELENLLEDKHERLSNLQEKLREKEQKTKELENLLIKVSKLQTYLLEKEQKIKELENLLIYQDKVLRSSWRWRTGSLAIGGIQSIKDFLMHPVQFLKEPKERLKIHYYGSPAIQFKNDSTNLAIQKNNQEVPQQKLAYQQSADVQKNDQPSIIFPPLGTYNRISMAATVPANDKNKISIGSVLDEFTFACFEPDARLLMFRPDNWQETLEGGFPEAILVESAWNGNEGSWQYKIAKYSRNMGDELAELLGWANKKMIPTIFWNKEDPAHFERFIEKARLFDYIFTSDADCIQRYQQEIGHTRVFALPFAAQPKIHNPILAQERLDNVCFAGTYYGDTYPERKQDMDIILKPAIDFGLHIFDRQFGITGPYADQFRFPDIYQPTIQGRLDYEAMLQAYKKYKVFLNVNSVKTSPTMFSRRVFELLASGTPVISTYSKGIEELLGNDLVLITESETDTKNHLEKLMNDDEYWSILSTRGIRKVHEEHTYKQRLNFILEKAHLPRLENTMPLFTIMTKISSENDINALIAMLTRQTYTFFEVVLLASEKISTDSIEKLQNALNGKTVRQVVGDSQISSFEVNGDYIMLVNINDYYGDNYLKDYAIATIYSNQVDYLGKLSHYVGWNDQLKLENPQNEFRYVSSAPTFSVAARKGLLNLDTLKTIMLKDSFELPDNKILSLDHFNYVKVPQNSGIYNGNTKNINI